MATIFAAFGKTLGNNKGSIQNFGIVGVTIASEEISKFIFFYCPCDYPRNQMYGTIFIWGPSIVLLIAGYLANRRTWRLTTGLCNRDYTLRKGMKRFVHFISTFTSIGVKAMIAPATWLVLAFLKGDYYTCAHWPDPDYDVNQTRKYYQLQYDGPLPKPCQFNSNPAKANLKLEAEVIARTLRAESHTIGWLFISMGMLLSVIIMFLFRCNSRFSYEQSNYIDRYRQHELELFEEKMDAKSKELAQHIVDTYFSKTRSKEDWDKIAVINDKVTRSKKGKAIYSPLHRFVNKQLNKIDENKCANDEEKKAIVAAKKAIKDGNVVEESAKTRRARRLENQKNKTDAGNTPIALNVMPTVLPSRTQHVAYVPQPNEPRDQTNNRKETSKEPTVPSSKPTGHTSPNQVSGESPSQTPNDDPLVPSKPPTHPDRERPVFSDDSKSETGSIRETSLGDFGGSYSIEDLSKSQSCLDEIDGEMGQHVSGVRPAMGDVDVNETQQENELFGHSEEAPLI